MQTNGVREELSRKIIGTQEESILNPRSGIGVGLLTGCRDRPYAFGLAMALISEGVHLDVIGSEETDSPELHATPNLSFLNFRGSGTSKASLAKKLWKLLIYYAKLLRYVARPRPTVLHVLWNNKIEFFDRTILMLYYKAMGKRIVLTAHNVNAGQRDGNDSFLNRLTLKIQYKLTDHIFVHTERMKVELLQDFGVAERVVTVIPFGINNSVPDTDLSPAQARRRLGIAPDEKVVLFFGRIRPYKGLEYLVEAFQQIVAKGGNYRLLIVGEPRGIKKEVLQYWANVQQRIECGCARSRITQRIEFVPDSETEVFFKAADISVLPYTAVFQSGILFLSHSFGLPVIATDVGSLSDDILEGVTGYLCRPRDSEDLARSIEKYFASELHKNLDCRRHEIRDYANAHHSWSTVGALTRDVYERLLTA
jgi:glycosyltransferase involved in cell wall biosynthesis